MPAPDAHTKHVSDLEGIFTHCTCSVFLTAEQREERLRRRKNRDRARKTAQSVKQRRVLLHRRCDQLNDESPEVKEVRLQQMSAQQHERLATEPIEVREVRLRPMSVQQRRRLATESIEVRKARLRQTSAQQRQQLATVRELRRLQISIYQNQRLFIQILLNNIQILLNNIQILDNNIQILLLPCSILPISENRARWLYS